MYRTTLKRQDLRNGKPFWIMLTAITVLVGTLPFSYANHQGHLEQHDRSDMDKAEGSGHPIPGLPFQVFTSREKKPTASPQKLENDLLPSLLQSSVQTVVDAFHLMGQHRKKYRRFNEALEKQVLEKVVIEPHVLNREGKEFFFLVARMKQPGWVKLLINASSLQKQGMLNHPEKLIPLLAREFQWVVSKADTKKKRKAPQVARNLQQAPIQTNKAIRQLSPEERTDRLQALLESYLTTIDAYGSLEDQPYYAVNSPKLIEPSQPDSTINYYDIRIREALQMIVREPSFQQETARAVRRLLNGKVWNVSFVHIESRDWATRTRVLPEDKAVLVGPRAQSIQPAKILINLHRKAQPEDPFFSDTQGLPMGALTTEQLARVIALEIHHNVLEKSMRGHVAQDEITAPSK